MTAHAATHETAPDARRGTRRRLWQLPTQAHELLLGLNVEPEPLRREAAKALGRERGGWFWPAWLGELARLNP